MPASHKTNFELPLFVGIDVGGTNVKLGIVDDCGRAVVETKFPTQPDKSPQLALDQAKRELDHLLSQTDFEWKDVVAAGLGTPGPLDAKTGQILTPTNLPGWHNFSIQDELAELLNLPVTSANDAGAAAFGEYWVGAGRRHESMVLFALGTGVGGGIIVNDLSIDGVHSHGSELGHVTIDTTKRARLCGCGRRGHLEAYASATALVDRTREAMASHNGDGSDAILRKQVGEDSPLSALMISNAASAGDRLALQMIAETAEYLGRGIAQLAHVIDPEIFILGGAMNFGGPASSQGQKFLHDVISAARKLVFTVVAQKLNVKYAELGSEAGYVGAAGLARQQHYKKVATI